MPSPAEIDSLYDNPAAGVPPPDDAAARQAIDALYGDHPSTSQMTGPPTPPAADTTPAGPPRVPGPQDGDGIFTRPIARAEDFLGSTWHSLKDAWTGAGKTEFPDQPELTQMAADVPGQTTGAGLRIAGAYALGSTPEQIADVATKALPGSTVSKDKFGNPQITFGDKTYYVKKPGFSPADLATGLGLVVPAALAATGIGAIPWLAGEGVAATGARALAQGVGQAGVSIGRDLGTSALGSDEGVSAGRATEAAAGGALGEPLAATGAALGRLIGTSARDAWRSMFGYGGKLIADAGGAAASDPVTPSMLTKTGQMVLDKAGVAPASMTVGQMQAAETVLGKGGGAAIGNAPAAQAGPTAARALQSARSGVPMTTGQLTGDPYQLALEDRLRHAVSSGKPIMADFGGQQTAAIDTRAGNLVPGVTPGATPPTEAELGQALTAQTQARAGALETATTNAYAKLPFLTKTGMASVPGPSAEFNETTARSLLDKMQQIAQVRSIYSGTPAAQQAQSEISKLITAPRQGMQEGVEGVAAMNGANPAALSTTQSRTFNLGDLDTTLRKLNTLYDSAANDSDRGAVGAMRGALNDHVDAAAMNGAVSGDPGVLQDWKDARAAARTQLEFLKPGSQAIQNWMDGVTSGAPSGQEVVNGLYGAGQLGTKAGTTQMLDHLQTQYPPGSAEWQTVQQAAVRRMLFGSTEKTADMSPNNIANRITEALQGNGSEITKALKLDPDTTSALGDFRDTMRTLQQSQRQNPSGTAYTAANALKALAQKVPFVGKAFSDEAAAVRQARAAVAPGLPASALTSPRLTDRPLGTIRQTIAPTGAAVLQQTSPQAPPSAVIRYPYAGMMRAGGLLGHLVP